MLDLAPILKRLAGISKWPWIAPSMFIFDATGNAIGSAIPDPYEGCSGKNNAALFGNAPQDIWNLIVEVMKLRKEVEDLESEMRDIEDAFHRGRDYYD